jgi:hypothetical protein
MVDQYPNVFLEELPGMPLDRDIGFVIELILGTAPIYKRSYSMSDKQLAELNKSRSYKERGIYDLVHHPGEHL